MYGYFDYKKAYLKDNERRVFTSYYCRLCYSLWNKGGQKARYLTTYDAVLYNLILAIADIDRCPPYFPCQRLKTSNKKYFKNDEMGRLIADLAILGFAIKVKDNQSDGDTFKAFLANLLFKRLINKTISARRELFDNTYALILLVDKLQSENAPIEDVLNAYGKTMEYSFHYFFDIEEKYLRVFNAIARWSFLIDMIDDYNDDVKHKARNSFYCEDSPTLSVLFQKHYYDFIPIVQNVCNELKSALADIESEKVEWTVLTKILQHSIATLVPDILNGLDVRYNFFKDMIFNCRNVVKTRKFNKKYEKNTVHNKGN